MSNYYSDYKGSDSNGTGIGSTPSAYGDKYPLARPVASYGTILPASAVTATPSLEQPSGHNESVTTTSANESNSATGVPGFEGAFAVAGFVIAALVLFGKKYRVK
jgi:hypothetical protein